MKEFFQFALVIGLVLWLVKPIGLYLVRVLNYGSHTVLDPIFKPLELITYRFIKVNPKQEQSWKEYLYSILIFSAFCLVATFFILLIQGYLPLNPQKMKNLSVHLAWNTAVSFVTNTNWQSYGGESTMSYLSQVWPLTLQNYLSAAVGLCVSACFARALSRSNVTTLGNFWVDLTRITLYLLLPLAALIAVTHISCGTPQNFKSYLDIVTFEGNTQTIVQGPIASQEAIKLLGTNGGGFTNANSAHPFENPTPFTNLIQIVTMLLIPCAQIYYYGQEIKNKKHAWTLLVSMMLIFAFGYFFMTNYEKIGNNNFLGFGLDTVANFEGKEMRFGIPASCLFSTTTTATSTGAVNCSHDSLTPLGGLIPFINMQLGEVIFGGVGSGLYGSLVFVILAIFIAGLIIGRTPEFLGKKIDSYDVKAAVFALIPFLVSILGFTAWAVMTKWGKGAQSISGAHGFSEILYAFSSTTANNGSAFSGLSTNTPIWNSVLSLAMLIGRFGVLIPTMALIGSLGRKKKLDLGIANFPVTGFTFGLLFIGTILLVGVLSFLPSLVMGPFIEQFFMKASKLI